MLGLTEKLQAMQHCIGNLARLIDNVEAMGANDILMLGKKARKRIEDKYTWEYIADLYEKVFRIVEGE